MAYKLKLNLIVDGIRCKNIEDIQDNFNLLDLIAYLKSGKLLKWAQVRNLDELTKKIDNIKTENYLEISKQLCEIFEIDCDESDLKDELDIYIIEQLLKDKDIMENLKQLKSVDNRIKELEKKALLIQDINKKNNRIKTSEKKYSPKTKYKQNNKTKKSNTSHSKEDSSFTKDVLNIVKHIIVPTIPIY